jgi:hypothetical protein
MALLDYSFIAILPFIFILSIPLAIFATITSFLAFSILLIRVLLIYFELAVAVIPYYLLGSTNPNSSNGISRIKSFITDQPAPGAAVYQPRRRKRRQSNSSSNSVGSLTPVASTSTLALNLGLPVALPLIQSVGPTRDFEGVGGWRLDGPSDDETTWTNINSRLELPADHVKRHKRSLTGGSMPIERTFKEKGRRRGERSYSPETTMTIQPSMASPNTSRARTPPTLGMGVDGYFPSQSQGGSPKLKKSSASITTNTSASSGSSKGSGGLSMKSRN